MLKMIFPLTRAWAFPCPAACVGLLFVHHGEPVVNFASLMGVDSGWGLTLRFDEDKSQPSWLPVADFRSQCWCVPPSPTKHEINSVLCEWSSSTQYETWKRNTMFGPEPQRRPQSPTQNVHNAQTGSCETGRNIGQGAYSTKVHKSTVRKAAGAWKRFWRVTRKSPVH